MTHPTTIQTLQCERCGGALAPRLAAHSACPFCGHHQDLRAIHARVGTYQRHVDHYAQAARIEHQRGVEWDPATNRLGRRAVTVLLVAVQAMGCFFVSYWLVGIRLPQSPSTGHQTLGTPIELIMKVGLLVFVVAGFVLLYLHEEAAKTSHISSAGATRVACPSCGSPALLRPGQQVQPCDQCGAALVPTERVMMRQVDAAQQAYRHLKLQRLRKERRTAAEWAQTTIITTPAIWVIYFVPLPLVLIPVLGAPQFDAWRPTLVAVGGVAIFAGILGLAVWLRHRRGKTRAWRSAMSDLARQFGGRLVLTLDERVRWLNHLWVAEIEPVEIYQGDFACAAAIDAYGYSTLLIADPCSTGPGRPPRVELLLAAWIPGLASDHGHTATIYPSPAGVEAWQWIASQGFEIRPSDGGLRAVAKPATVAMLHRKPMAVHALAPIIRALATVASAVRAEPVLAIP